jgi:hypothetical protein
VPVFETSRRTWAGTNGQEEGQDDDTNLVVSLAGDAEMHKEGFHTIVMTLIELSQNSSSPKNLIPK